MDIVRTRTFSRVGLLGNPSDGYYGKTLSFTLRDFCAEVILYQWDTLELIPSQEDHSRFGSIHELASDVELHGYYGGIRLLKATIKRFVDYCQQQGHELHARNFSIRYESNIPRQVGLAGSSAIVVATLRALLEFYEVNIPLDVQASLALSVETKELGITAGLQDRVAQVYDSLVYMDFSRERMVQRHGYECGCYAALDPSLLPPLYVAYKADASEPTEVFHNHLRERYLRGDGDVVSAMRKFAAFAEQGRTLLADGNADGLGELIDANFDLRQSICRLPDDHVQMIQVARAAGASAKFAGSGGAIVGTYGDLNCYARLQRDLTEIGCRVLTADTARLTTEAS